MIATRYASGETMTGLVSEFGAGEAKFGERFGLNRLPDKQRGFSVKIGLSHVLHWPPQRQPVAGVAIIGGFVAPEIVWPALVTGLIAIIGDDGTRPENEGKLIPEHVFARTAPSVPAEIALRSGLCHKPPMIERVAQALTSRHPWLKAAQVRARCFWRLAASRRRRNSPKS